MNILIINGSPRKKGLISQMLGIVQEEAVKRGDTVEMVYPNDLTVKPCTGCMVCRTKEKCVLAEDDSQRVLKMMQQADAIIMGAPRSGGSCMRRMIKQDSTLQEQNKKLLLQSPLSIPLQLNPHK